MEWRSAVMEVYSPPRVDALARTLGLMPGMTLDLKSVDPDASTMLRATMVAKRSAMLVVGSPMCSAFSQLQSLNWRQMGPERESTS